MGHIVICEEDGAMAELCDEAEAALDQEEQMKEAKEPKKEPIRRRPILPSVKRRQIPLAEGGSRKGPYAQQRRYPRARKGVVTARTAIEAARDAALVFAARYWPRGFKSVCDAEHLFVIGRESRNSDNWALTRAVLGAPYVVQPIDGPPITLLSSEVERLRATGRLELRSGAIFELLEGYTVKAPPAVATTVGEDDDDEGPSAPQGPEESTVVIKEES